MSRIGKRPVPIPEQVKVLQEENLPGGKAGKLRVEGPKGVIEQRIPPGINVIIGDKEVKIEPQKAASKSNITLQGTIRALVSNMITGVSAGYQKILLIEGTGYRAKLEDQKLILQLGFANLIQFEPPDGIKLEVPEPQKIVISGIDKQLVGDVTAKIRALKPPEPYKGKGIRYEGEYVRRKTGKKAIT